MHRSKIALLLAVALVTLTSFAGAQDRRRERPDPTPTVEREQGWTPEQVAEFRVILGEISDARASLVAAERRLVEFVVAGPNHTPPTAEPPTEPPTPPPVVPPEDPPPPPAGGLSRVPFYVPPIPSYRVPTLIDCDWTIEDGVATSRRGLPSITGTDLVAMAYKASAAALHAPPITIGVWDSGGTAVPGGQWNPSSSRSISIPDGDGGYLGVQLEIVGLDESCEVSVGWSRKWGHADYVGVFNIGIRGPPDSFIIRSNDGIGRLIIDGCWWLPAQEMIDQGGMHASGMHVDGWGTLVWRNHKFRGNLPTDPGTSLQEHSAYFKSCAGEAVETWATIDIPPLEVGTWIVGNDLKGGNRSGFQVRPGRDGNDRPVGPVVIAFNHSDGYGWNHGSGGETYDGGAAMTSWVGPESDVYVLGNQITDAKYSCLVISGQSPARNWLNSKGKPVRNVHLWGNRFENLRGDRGCASISACQSVTFWPGNTYDGSPNGDLTIDSAWNWKQNGILIGDVRISDQATADAMKGLNLKTYDEGQPNRAKAYEKSLLDGYVVPPPQRR
tara:strand:- start:6808 stop:8472 length:1665 start_codon:yes stop_codon:yes gene_type:complete